MQRTKLYTPRFVLRPLVKADYATWREAVTSGPKDPEFEPAPKSPRQSSRAAFEKIIARHARRAREDYVYVLNVFLRERRVLVGAVDITILHRGPLQLGNLGYRVFRPYRRRGYAKEAVSAAMHFAFERLQLNRLEAVLERENRPSRALARTLGMTRECIRRRYYFDGGRFVDQEVWSAQREDFGHPPLQRVRR